MSLDPITARIGTVDRKGRREFCFKIDKALVVGHWATLVRCLMICKDDLYKWDASKWDGHSFYEADHLLEFWTQPPVQHTPGTNPNDP